MISFIVPLHNHLRYTQQMLDSLLSSLPDELNFEVIFADDASSDGTEAWLSSLAHPRVRWLVNPQNLGYAATNNRGVVEARGEVLGLLNNDLIFSLGWLNPMLDVLDNPRLSAGVVGNVQYRVADAALDHAGVQLNLQGQFEHIRTLPTDGRNAVETLAVTGACMLLRKADFEAVGGFDERYVNGAEDIDLCLKLHAAGRKIYVAPESQIHHHVSLSRKSVTDRDERNSQALFARWRSEIKCELARLWAERLADTQRQDDASALVGTLAPHFIATPHAAGRTLAEALLQRQEQRWGHMLDGTVADDDLAARCRFAGLQFNAVLNGCTLAETARVIVEALPYARNFYVCGRTLATINGSRLQLHIDINGLQHLRIPLRPNAHFNAGLAHPLLLNGVPNVFTLRVERLDENGTPCGSGHAHVVVGHFVVDEQQLSLEHL